MSDQETSKDTKWLGWRIGTPIEKLVEEVSKLNEEVSNLNKILIDLSLSIKDKSED